MRPLVRGLLVTALWMGLAMGFTSMLADVLHDRQVVDPPARSLNSASY